MNNSEVVLTQQALKVRGNLIVSLPGKTQSLYCLILGGCLCGFQDASLDNEAFRIPLTVVSSIKLCSDLQFEIIVRGITYSCKTQTLEAFQYWFGAISVLKTHLRSKSNTKTQKSGPSAHSKIIVQRLKNLIPSFSANPTESKETSNKQVTKELFTTIGLRFVADMLSKQWLQNHILAFEFGKNIYWTISCKVLKPHYVDERILPPHFVAPFDLNCLYQFSKDTGQTEIVSRCKDIQIAETEVAISLRFSNKEALILRNNQENRSVGDRLKVAAAIGLQYHNEKQMRINKNIDPYLMEAILHPETAKVMVQREVRQLATQVMSANEFIKVVTLLKENLCSFIEACELKHLSVSQYRKCYIEESYHLTLEYLRETWENLHAQFDTERLLMLVPLIDDIWRLVRRFMSANNILEGNRRLVKRAFRLFEEEMARNVGHAPLSHTLQSRQAENYFRAEPISVSCDWMKRILYQSVSPLKLVLDTAQMQEELWIYLKNVCQNYVGRIQKRKQSEQIESLVEAANNLHDLGDFLLNDFSELASDNESQRVSRFRSIYLKEIASLLNKPLQQIIMKMFIHTLQPPTLDALQSPFVDLKIEGICSSIIGSIDKYLDLQPAVKKSLVKHAFEEVCLFCFSSFTKFKSFEKQQTKALCEKLTCVISAINKAFERFLEPGTRFSKLKNLDLLNDFIFCESKRISKVYANLKKAYRASFSELTFKCLFSLRHQDKDGCQMFERCCLQMGSPNELSSQTSDSPIQGSYLSNRCINQSITSSVAGSFRQNCPEEIYNNRTLSRRSPEGFLTLCDSSALAEDQISLSSYVKLQHDALLIFSSDDVLKPSQKIRLSNIKKISSHKVDSCKIIVETDAETLHLKAHNAEEATFWIQSICQELHSFEFRLSAECTAALARKETELFPDYLTDQSTAATDQIRGIRPKKNIKKTRDSDEGCQLCWRNFFG